MASFLGMATGKIEEFIDATETKNSINLKAKE
jgi:hypothetical protein